MTLNEYTTACVNYAKAMAECLHDPTGCRGAEFATTDNSLESWRFSCDNAHGGLDVSWAYQFRHNPDKVPEYAPAEFVRLLLEDLRVSIDDEWDFDQLEALYQKFN